METMLIHEHGTIIVTADAWGTIVTPTGTYNTLRVKSARTYTDSVWVSGIFISANTYSQTSYEWYTDSSHTPVFSISITQDGSTASYRTDNVTHVEKQMSPTTHVNIFPNPVTDHFTIQSDKEFISIKIFSLEGSLISDISATNPISQRTIPFNNISKGSYILKIGFKDGTSVTKSIIK